MSDLDDLLGTAKAPKQPKLNDVGDTYIGRVVGDPKVMPVKQFVKGVPGETLFWQNRKPVVQSQLDKNLPYEPMKQIWVKTVDQQGDEYSIYFEGDKLKKLRAYLRENPDERLADGSMVKLWVDDKDETFNIPKKLWGVVVKAPKE